MDFEWGEDKNRENIRKHGVSFEDAKKIFDGPVWSREDDRFRYSEERWISMGLVGGHVVLVVAHTDRDDITRIISARRASKKEQRIYHDKLKEIAPEGLFSGLKKDP
jgi:uncharacterized DUF497 family protein